MLLYSLSLLAGLYMLVWGADRVVAGTAAIARNAGISPMLIGMTIVGFATSLPEMLVSATAAATGATNLAVGNALGSNIANIGLVLGAAAITVPLTVRSASLRRELPVMLAVSVLPVALFADQTLGRLDGSLLLLGLAGFVGWTIMLARQMRGRDPLEAAYEADIPAGLSNASAGLRAVIGLVILMAGANALVWGAENLARAIGVSDLIIGITVVAVGTSLPELAVSVVSVRKGEHGLALGNIIGSNIFNLLAVVGIAGVIGPDPLDPAVIQLHLPVMLGFTLGFFVIAYNRDGAMRVGRTAGALLLAAWCAYIGKIAATLF